MNHSAQKGERGQGDSSLSPGFVQKFVEKDGQMYPPHVVSDFALGRRGCYLCDDDHVSRDFPRRNELKVLQIMRCSMHYYQSNMYFKLDRFGNNPCQHSQSFNTHNDRNKRPRLEDSTIPEGAVRGNRSTLPL